MERNDANFGAAQLDRLEIVDIIQRERALRDEHRWDEMAECFNNDSEVDISWFRGTGRGFAMASKDVDRTRGGAPTNSRGFHEIGNTMVRQRGNRAIAVTPIIVHVLCEVDGVEVDIVAHTQLLSRVERKTDRWLISGIRSIYVQDMMIPLDPSRAPQLDQADLASFRPSYRFLSYFHKNIRQAEAHDDQPGMDRPAQVKALKDNEEAWLDAAG